MLLKKYNMKGSATSNCKDTIGRDLKDTYPRHVVKGIPQKGGPKAEDRDLSMKEYNRRRYSSKIQRHIVIKVP